MIEHLNTLVIEGDRGHQPPPSRPFIPRPWEEEEDEGGDIE